MGRPCRVSGSIMADPTPATSETPATIPIGQAPDLSTYREARDKGLTEIPNPAATATTSADEAPDPEVDADPDLKAAVDALETPAANETPQQRGARTKKHKERAKQSITTRFKHERDAARAELDEWRSGKRAPHSVSQVAPVPQPTVTAGASAETADDPEPTFKAWAAAHPYHAEQYGDDHPDPYGEWQAEYQDAKSAWRTRRAESAAAQSRQAQQADQDAKVFTQRFQQAANTLAQASPDYDAVVDPFLAAHTGTAYEPALLFALSRVSDPASLLYHLARTPATMDRFIGAARQGREAVLEECGVLRTELAATRSGAAAPVIKTPPEPHQPGGSGGSAATTFDVKSEHGSIEAWRAHRERVGARR